MWPYKVKVRPFRKDNRNRQYMKQPEEKRWSQRTWQNSLDEQQGHSPDIGNNPTSYETWIVGGRRSEFYTCNAQNNRTNRDDNSRWLLNR